MSEAESKKACNEAEVEMRSTEIVLMAAKAETSESLCRNSRFSGRDRDAASMGARCVMPNKKDISKGLIVRSGCHDLKVFPSISAAERREVRSTWFF